MRSERYLLVRGLVRLAVLVAGAVVFAGVGWLLVSLAACW